MEKYNLVFNIRGREYRALHEVIRYLDSSIRPPRHIITLDNKVVTGYSLEECLTKLRGEKNERHKGGYESRAFVYHRAQVS